MTKLKGKQKTIVLCIRIEVYYWIIPNKSQTKIIMLIYNTQKNSEWFFQP